MEALSHEEAEHQSLPVTSSVDIWSLGCIFLDMGSFLIPKELTSTDALRNTCTQLESGQKKRSKYYIPGFLDGRHIRANPDSGSSHDAVSESYVAEKNISIDVSDAEPIRLPAGQQAISLGTVTLPFRFEQEAEEFPRVFQVIKGLSQDCILGPGFLKMTQTLTDKTNYLRRIHRAVDGIASKVSRCYLAGSFQERLQGVLDGYLVDALPDTGSDLNIISRQMAEQLGMEVWAGDGHTKLLEFANGFVVRTLGTVYDAEWCFGWGETAELITCEFQLLDDISGDIILGNDFLFDNNAFQLYGDCFYDIPPRGEAEGWSELYMISECLMLDEPMEDAMMEVYRYGNQQDLDAGLPPTELQRPTRLQFRLWGPRPSSLAHGSGVLPSHATSSSEGEPGDTGVLHPPPLQPQKRGWLVRIVRLVVKNSDYAATQGTSQLNTTPSATRPRNSPYRHVTPSPWPPASSTTTPRTC